MYLNKPLFLIGLRASGKTALGKNLCRHFSVPFYDTDSLITDKCGQNIAAIVETYGWQYFREQETHALKNIPLETSIVSTGGGIILDTHNRKYIKENGICIFLDPPLSIICGRLQRNHLSSQRPAFANESIEEEVTRLHNEREQLYRDTATLRVDSSKRMNALVAEIQRFVDTL